MSSIDLSCTLNGTNHVAMKANLLFSGHVEVILYVNHRKGELSRSMSFMAGGSNQLYLTRKYDTAKYSAYVFTLKWNETIHSAYVACNIVLRSITSLVVE